MTAVAYGTTGSPTKGKTFYFIPKDTLNPYEVIADRGGKIALTQLGNKQVVSSGTQDTAAAQQPSIQAAIQTGADGIVIAANDPQAVCPALKQAMAKGMAVVSFDSDSNCRQLFINQADTETIGRSQIAAARQADGLQGRVRDPLGGVDRDEPECLDQVHEARAEEARYKNMKLVKIYYGNDNPAQSLQATESMLQAYPNLKGIESPTTVGISSAAQFLSNSKSTRAGSPSPASACRAR